MAKKTYAPVSSGKQGWDATLDDDLKLVFEGPVPLFEGSAPSAGQNDRGLMATNDVTAGWVPYFSDGTSWRIIPKQAAAVSAFSDSIGGTVADALAAIPDLGDSPATADALRDDLQTNWLPKLRDALSSLAAKWNTARTAFRNSGILP